MEEPRPGFYRDDRGIEYWVSETVGIWRILRVGNPERIDELPLDAVPVAENDEDERP